MTVQLDGQLDLLDLLAEPNTPSNNPFYACVCGARIQCDTPVRALVDFQEDHRAHGEAFQAAQWPGGRENHPDGKHYGPLFTIAGRHEAPSLTVKAPHPVNTGMRYVCPCCLTNWGELNAEVQARLRSEHEEVKPWICRHMLRIQEVLDRLNRGEWESSLVWTDASKESHLASVTNSRDTIWAHHEGRPTPWAGRPAIPATPEGVPSDGLTD